MSAVAAAAGVATGTAYVHFASKEELLIGGNVSKTDNPMILRAEEEMLAWDDLKLIIDELEGAIDSGDQFKLRQLLIKAVPGFKPQSGITDILYEA